MSKLSKRHKDFADEYIITSNVYKSAKEAGYSENYSKSQSYKLLENVGIQEYMKEKTKQLQIEKHLTMEEALAITASIAKGEPQRFSSKVIEPETGETLEEEINEYSAGFKERNQALEHFYKINGVFTEKRDVDLKNTDINIVIGDKDGD